MGRDIRTALENAGISVMEYLRSDFQNDALGKVMVKALVDCTGPKFFLDMNANEHYRVGDRTLFDVYKIPRASFITDSPLRHISKIRAMPANTAVGLVDGDFPEILSEFDLPQHPFAFPHAGPPPLRDPIDVKSRTIRTLFAGNIGPSPTRNEFIDLHGGTDTAKRRAVERVLEEAYETDKGFYSLCKQYFPDLDRSIRLDIANDLETHVIARRREDLLRNLGGTGVVVCGEIHSSIRRSLPEDLTYRGGMTFEDIADLMGRTRVLINSSPSFRNGAHERVFYGLSRGVRVVTEPTRFFSEEDRSALDLQYLPFAPSKVKACVDNALEGSGDAMVQRMAHYGKTHTWAQRVPQLLAAMEPHWG